MFWSHRAGQFGVDDPGRKGVDVYTTWGDVGGERAGQANDAGLGSRVMCVPDEVAPLTRNGADVQDLPVAALQHRGQDRPATVEGALEVSIEHRVPPFLADVEE